MNRNPRLSKGMKHEKNHLPLLHVIVYRIEGNVLMFPLKITLTTQGAPHFGNVARTIRTNRSIIPKIILRRTGAGICGYRTQKVKLARQVIVLKTSTTC
jgi:hypothetical protein